MNSKLFSWMAILFVAGALVALVMDFVFQKPESPPYGAAGDTYATQQIAVAGFGTGVATQTVVSLYNGSGRDRWIENTEVFYNNASGMSSGTGFDLMHLYAATSTSASSGIRGGGATSTSLIYNSIISSSTPQFFESSSTPGDLNLRGAGLRLWANGTYLNFVSNIFATTTSGFIGVRYFTN